MLSNLITILSLAATATSPEIFTQIAKGYETYGDTHIHFQQSYEDALRGTKRSESGEIYLSKDGKVRWVYRKPARKDFIFNGTSAYFYEPEFAQVTVFEKFAGSPLAQTLGALWGQGNLQKHFVLTKTTPASETEPHIRLYLEPKETLSGVSSVELAIDAKRYLVEESKLIDPLGNATIYRFKNFKKLKDLKAEIFDFQIPEGTNVLRGQSAPQGS